MLRSHRDNTCGVRTIGYHEHPQAARAVLFAVDQVIRAHDLSDVIAGRLLSLITSEAM